MRYKGQSFELEIKQARRRHSVPHFIARILLRYGYAQKTNAVEIVSARLRSSGVVDKIRQTRLQRRRAAQFLRNRCGFRKVCFERRETQVAVYQRELLKAGSSPPLALHCDGVFVDDADSCGSGCGCGWLRKPTDQIQDLKCGYSLNSLKPTASM